MNVRQASASGGDIQSVRRAIQLLMLVADRTTNNSGKELAQAAELSPPTAHHLLATLVQSGLLSQDDNARYHFGPRVAHLSAAYQQDVSAPTYMLLPLHRLAKETGETGYLAAWRNHDIHLLAVVDGQLPVRTSVPAGQYVDAHARATGKLLLAYANPEIRNLYLATHPLRKVTANTITSRTKLDREFDAIRERGYAEECEEFQEGVSCASAPFLDGDTIIASYTLSVPSERFAARKDDIVAAVLRCAAAATANLPSIAASPPAERKRTGTRSPRTKSA